MPPYLLCDAAVDLVLRNEGLNQPGKWPGGASGITIGYGYDLGYTTTALFAIDWRRFFSAPHFRRLNEVIGLKGRKAAIIAETLSDIRITKVDARNRFLNCSAPRYWRITSEVFPGVRDLSENVQGALFSLVYNRGGSMTGERRREMRAIQKAVVNKDTEEIARQIRSMKRLWIGQGLDGLLTRREEEACLVEMV